MNILSKLASAAFAPLVVTACMPSADQNDNITTDSSIHHQRFAVMTRASTMTNHAMTVFSAMTVSIDPIQSFSNFFRCDLDTVDNLLWSTNREQMLDSLETHAGCLEKELSNSGIEYRLKI